VDGGSVWVGGVGGFLGSDKGWERGLDTSGGSQFQLRFIFTVLYVLQRDKDHYE
jgi:hypothetical protein